MPLIKTIVNQTRNSVSVVKPLSGLNVIDFSMAYAGPICGRMLSDCGADVIKVEPLGVGDGVRGDDLDCLPAFCVDGDDFTATLPATPNLENLSQFVSVNG